VSTAPTPTGHLTLRVVTPEGAAFDGPATSVVVPSHDGETAFQRGHAAFVGLLGTGELRVTTTTGATEHHFLSGGVVQVVDDVVTVLAESVAPAASIDATKAQADLERASRMPTSTDAETTAKFAALAAARAKLRLADRAKGGVAAH
jgi:F-type H+-transporting ATPase subunit epsilon